MCERFYAHSNSIHCFPPYIYMQKKKIIYKTLLALLHYPLIAYNQSYIISYDGVMVYHFLNRNKRLRNQSCLKSCKCVPRAMCVVSNAFLDIVQYATLMCVYLNTHIYTSGYTILIQSRMDEINLYG